MGSHAANEIDDPGSRVVWGNFCPDGCHYVEDDETKETFGGNWSKCLRCGSVSSLDVIEANKRAREQQPKPETPSTDHEDLWRRLTDERN